MRIAVMVISLCLVMILGVQSCAVGVGSSMIGDEATSQAGAFGVFLAFLFVLGAAFVLRLPGVSAAIFLIGGVLAIGSSSQGGKFTDLSVWAVASLVLGIMALLGRRELRATDAGTTDGPSGVYRRYVGVGDPDHRRRGLPAIVWAPVLLIIAGAATLFGGGFVTIGNRQSAPPQSATVEPQQIVQVTAQEIAAAYDANEVAAQLRFGNRTLDITGVVSSISLDAADQPVVMFVGSGSITGHVRAEFDKAWSSQIAAMSVGDTVTVRCTSIAELMGAGMLSGCSMPPPVVEDGNDVGLLDYDEIDNETAAQDAEQAEQARHTELTKVVNERWLVGRWIGVDRPPGACSWAYLDFQPGHVFVSQETRGQWHLDGTTLSFGASADSASSQRFDLTEAGANEFTRTADGGKVSYRRCTKEDLGRPPPAPAPETAGSQNSSQEP